MRRWDRHEAAGGLAAVGAEQTPCRRHPVLLQTHRLGCMAGRAAAPRSAAPGRVSSSSTSPRRWRRGCCRWPAPSQACCGENAPREATDDACGAPRRVAQRVGRLCERAVGADEDAHGRLGRRGCAWLESQPGRHRLESALLQRIRCVGERAVGADEDRQCSVVLCALPGCGRRRSAWSPFDSCSTACKEAVPAARLGGVSGAAPRHPAPCRDGGFAGGRSDRDVDCATHQHGLRLFSSLAPTPRGTEEE